VGVKPLIDFQPSSVIDSKFETKANAFDPRGEKALGGSGSCESLFLELALDATCADAGKLPIDADIAKSDTMAIEMQIADQFLMIIISSRMSSDCFDMAFCIFVQRLMACKLLKKT
jgi:hypothetical protein